VNVAGYYLENILDGKRHSVADAFLTRRYRGESRRCRSQMLRSTKIVFEGSEPSERIPCATARPSRRARHERSSSGGGVIRPRRSC
jgi:hypothetical protein